MKRGGIFTRNRYYTDRRLTYDQFNYDIERLEAVGVVGVVEIDVYHNRVGVLSCGENVLVKSLRMLAAPDESHRHIQELVFFTTVN